MATGKIVQVIGAVVDVEFPQDAVPRVYDALEVQNGNERLVLEVQQQLGGGIVRTIAMGSSDGLRRGLDVKDLEHPIEVPVGKATLGRIMNVLGEPVDMKGEIGEEERWAIHRAAPSYEELSNSQELLETGIKVIDLMCPFAKGGKVGLFGGAGELRRSSWPAQKRYVVRSQASRTRKRSLKRWRWSPLPKCVNRRIAWRPAVLMQKPCAK